MNTGTGASLNLDPSLAELLGELWKWPGSSATVELLVARSLLTALVDEANRSLGDDAGFLLGRHMTVRSGGQERECVLVLDYGLAAPDDGLAAPDDGLAAPNADAVSEGLPAGEPLSAVSSSGLSELEPVGWFRFCRTGGPELSEAERRYFQDTFSEPYHVAYVFDAEHRSGRFFTRDGPSQGDPPFDPAAIVANGGRSAAMATTGPLGPTRRLSPGRISDGAIALMVLAVGLAATLLLERSPARLGPAGAPQRVTRSAGSPRATLEVLPARTGVRIALEAGKKGDSGFWVLREGPLPSGEIKALAGSKPVAGRKAVILTDSPRRAGAYRYLVLPREPAGGVGPPWDSAALGLQGKSRAALGLF